MKRAALFFLLFGCSSTEEPDPRTQRGADAYTKYCALCHGDRGHGYVADNANALAHPEFLTTATDDASARRPSLSASAASIVSGLFVSDAPVSFTATSTVASLKTAGGGVCARVSLPHPSAMSTRGSQRVTCQLMT